MGGGWSLEQVPDMTGKVALITGANSGIGFYVALELGRAKADVVIACRSQERGEEAVAAMKAAVPGGRFILKLLDVSSISDVERFSAEFLRDFKQLHILINNAGIMAPPTYRTSPDGFEIQMATNHLGPFALTGRLLPLLAATPGARVVAVSSLAAFRARKYPGPVDFTLSAEGYNGTGIYADTKLANQLFMDELARRHPEVVSVGAHPGITKSNIHSDNYTGKLTWAMQGPQMGALPVLRAAVEPDLRSGSYFSPRGLFGVGGSPTDRTYRPRTTRDAAYAAKYWAASEEATGIKY